MPAGSCSFQVGAIRCTVLSDGYSAYPASWFFPRATQDQLAPRLRAEKVITPYTCLLIETGRHVVLVDTGGGALSETDGALLARLERAGIRPRDVEAVVLTHAHPDHIGGAVNPAGRPVFPEARHILAEQEWDFWTGRADLKSLRLPAALTETMRTTARRCLRAIRFQSDPIWRDSEIVPGVHAMLAPGHTPGQLAVRISSDGEHLLHLADAVVHPLHCEEPDWECGFDLAPERAIATRRALLEDAADPKTHVMAFHLPFPSVGRLTLRDAGGWTWNPGW